MYINDSLFLFRFIVAFKFVIRGTGGREDDKGGHIAAATVMVAGAAAAEMVAVAAINKMGPVAAVTIVMADGGGGGGGVGVRPWRGEMRPKIAAKNGFVHEILFSSFRRQPKENSVSRVLCCVYRAWVSAKSQQTTPSTTTWTAQWLATRERGIATAAAAAETATAVAAAATMAAAAVYWVSFRSFVGWTNIHSSSQAAAATSVNALSKVLSATFERMCHRSGIPLPFLMTFPIH